MAEWMTLAELKGKIDEFNRSPFAKANGLVAVTDSPQWRGVTEEFMKCLESIPEEKESDIPEEFTDLYNKLSGAIIKEKKDEGGSEASESPKQGRKKKAESTPEPEEEESEPEPEPEEEDTGDVSKKEFMEAVDWLNENRGPKTSAVDPSDYSPEEKEAMVTDFLTAFETLDAETEKQMPASVRRVHARLASSGAEILKTEKANKGGKTMFGAPKKKEGKPAKAPKEKKVPKAPKEKKAPKEPKEKKVTVSMMVTEKLLAGPIAAEKILSFAKAKADAAGQKQFQSMGTINSHLKWLGTKGYKVTVKDDMITVKAPTGK